MSKDNEGLSRDATWGLITFAGIIVVDICLASGSLSICTFIGGVGTVNAVNVVGSVKAAGMMAGYKALAAKGISSAKLGADIVNILCLDGVLGWFSLAGAAVILKPKNTT